MKASYDEDKEKYRDKIALRVRPAYDYPAAPERDTVVDIGNRLELDILDPVQPAAAGMEPSRIKSQFGDRLAFHGGIDEQHLLPHGTPDDVRNEVRRLIDATGTDGAYIVCPAHAIQPDTPPENIMAIYDTALE